MLALPKAAPDATILIADDDAGHARLLMKNLQHPAEVEPCHSLGRNHYLVKPVDYERFSAVIQQFGQFANLAQLPEISLVDQKNHSKSQILKLVIGQEFNIMAKRKQNEFLSRQFRFSEDARAPDGHTSQIMA